MFYKGALQLNLKDGKDFVPADFGDGSDTIFALYNNDMGVTARVQVMYKSGEIATISIPQGQRHEAMIVKVFAAGTSVGPNGVLAYR